MNRKWRALLAILLLLIGLGVLMYPTASSYLNSLRESYAIQELQEVLEGQTDTQLARQRALAEAYNRSLSVGDLTDAFGESEYGAEYDQILDYGEGVMGYLTIPKLELELPIYHGTSKEVLAKGVGHLPQSALPIGGAGNHTVLSGHTGMPNARLFTDLTELAEGDVFYIHILDETLTYQVDQILTVLPEETQALQPEAGKDFCTLVSCTPYGVNSHRLLVRGERGREAQAEQPQTAEPGTVSQKPAMPLTLKLALGAAALLLVVGAVILFRKNRG